MRSLRHRVLLRILGAVTSAVLVVAGSVAVAAPASAADADTGTIWGVVTDPDGQPVSYTSVVAFIADDSAADSVGSFTTGESGSFSIELPVGDYRVRFSPGPSDLAIEWWSDAASSIGSQVVTVAAGSSTDLSTQLEPAASIAGVVTDAANGGPVGGVSVHAYRYESMGDLWVWVGRSALTAADGTYRVTGLRSGKYAVRFTSAAGASIVEEYWNQAGWPPDPDTAFDVSEGQQVTGISPSVDRVIAPGTPTITGTPVVGSTLTAAPGLWTAGTVFTYQWYANGVAVGGATAATLKLTSAQADERIAVKVTGVFPGHSTDVKTSAWTAKVLTAGTPRIVGIPATGETLLVDRRVWTPGTTFTQQWYADGEPIAGATSITVPLKLAQAGKQITVKVTGSNPGYPTVTKTSSVSLKVMQATKPTISGEVRVGGVLTANRGTWSAGATIDYQWYAAGVPIPGATTYRLTLSAAERDKRIMVEVTGTKSGFATYHAFSDLTLRVATTSKPTISGNYAVGSTLTAKPNTWTTGTRFSYQWLVDGVPISGATGSTLRLAVDQRDRRISVAVTGRRSGWPTITRMSGQSPRVATVGDPSISFTTWDTYSGKVTTMFGHGGRWTLGTTLSYQWIVDGRAVAGYDIGVSGHQAPALQAPPSWAGKRVTLKVVGKMAGYQTFTRYAYFIVPR
jgi:hypothetical protein